MLETWNKKEIEVFHHDVDIRTFHGEVCAKYIFKMARAYIGSKVLDVGAGSGALIALIPSGIGIDLIARPERHIQKDDITDLSFKDGSFDTVFCTEVLEHLNDEDLELSVQEIYRVLKKGGKLIITVPYKETLSLQIIQCPFCGKHYHRYGHQRSFDRASLKNLLEHHGFYHHLKSVTIPLFALAKHPYFLTPVIKIVSRFTDRWKNSMNLFWVAEK